MTTPDSDPYIRMFQLCAALELCDPQIRILVKAGLMPAPCFRKQGSASLWRMSDLRAWRPDIATRIDALKRLPPLTAPLAA